MDSQWLGKAYGDCDCILSPYTKTHCLTSLVKMSSYFQTTSCGGMNNNSLGCNANHLGVFVLTEKILFYILTNLRSFMVTINITGLLAVSLAASMCDKKKEAIPLISSCFQSGQTSLYPTLLNHW